MTWPSGPIGVDLGVSPRNTLAAVLTLGLMALSTPSMANCVRISRAPYAWIQSDGQVLAWNLSKDNVAEIAEEASMLLNDPDYVVVTNYVIYSDSEDLSDRIFYLEGASLDDLRTERLRLEVEHFYAWEQPLYQVTL